MLAVSSNKDDADWVRQSFLLPKGAIDTRDQVRRTYSEVSRKFTDTTLGGNYVINPPAQFTRYADPKQRRVKTISKGMGLQYSEQFDDTMQIVNMRFGVPEFNSLTTFFTTFYDADLAMMARTGRTGGLAYSFGKMIGFVIGIPLTLPIMTGRTLRFFLNWPASKYYYLKPAMALYWNTVNSILNELAVNLSLIPPMVQTKYDESKNAVFSEAKITAKQRDEFNKLLPDIFRGDGGVDIYAVATRAHRLSRSWEARVNKEFERGGTIEEIMARIEKLQQEPLTVAKRARSMNDYMQSYLAIDASKPPEVSTAQNVSVKDPNTGEEKQVPDAVGAPEMVGSFYPKEQGLFQKTWEYMNAEEQDGGQFVSFRTDFTGAASESFSNSVRESDLQSTINSTSSTMRNSRFTIADGNLGDATDGPLGFMAATLEGVVSAGKAVINGVASQVGMSGLATLAGSAFVDIPKHYEASIANLPRAEFTIPLRSPYGNDLSRFMNLYVPLAMLLAGALPLSAGNAAYVSPFLVECYCRGRCQIRLGMIDSISIQRGVGNLGWNKDGKPLGIDVTFSIVDMSSILHIPIVPSTSPLDLLSPTKAVAKIFAEDSTYKDYLAVLSSMTLSSQIYQLPKLFRHITKVSADMNSWFTASHFANWFRGTLPGSVWSAVVLGTNRL